MLFWYTLAWSIVVIVILFLGYMILYGGVREPEDKDDV